MLYMNMSGNLGGTIIIFYIYQEDGSGEEKKTHGYTARLKYIYVHVISIRSLLQQGTWEYT